MKSLKFLLALLLAGLFGQAYGQTVLANYDGAEMNFSSWGSATWSKVANPSRTGINTSANVGQFGHGGLWIGVHGNSALPAGIDFAANPYFRMKVYSASPIKVTLKFENFIDYTINAEQTVELSASQVNKWVELTFDFSGVVLPNLDRVTLYFDGPNSFSSAGTKYYFDDLIGSATKGINVNGFLKASGTKVLKGDGSTFISRGVGPGGWMLQEGYMFGTQVGTQHEIRAMLENLTDKATTDAFYDSWLKNFFTRNDVKLVSEYGFNTIRVPLHYNLFTLPIEQEPVKGQNTWLAKGFQMTDSLVTWCEDNDVYLVLDLHGAPGGQGKNADISDYDSSKPSLWESEYNRSKTVAIWRKLAERYKDNVHVGGYDLLNETNWDFENSNNENGCNCQSNIPLVKLYERIIDTIRVVDKNHMLFLEGNCWANNWNGLETLIARDKNVAFSWHKYWTYNTDNVITGILDFSKKYNIPTWLGETGENSNTWLTEMVMQMERLGIGWSQWAYKQMDIDDLYSIKSNKWKYIQDFNPKTGANRPSVANAKLAMAEILENIKTENCKFNPDVVYAFTGLPFNAPSKPFTTNKIPGIIYASDFDMGKLNSTWYDLDYQDFHVSSNTYTAWNQGYVYRNDGVDLQECTDAVTNGYHVGWTNPGEWMKYSVASVVPGTYNITFRVAASEVGLINLKLNNTLISTQHISVAKTGGYSSWKDLTISNVVIGSDITSVTLFIMSTGYNINYIKFDLITPTSLAEPKNSATTNLITGVRKDEQLIHIALENKSEIPVTVTGADLYDAAGCKLAENRNAFTLDTTGEVTLEASTGKGIGVVRLYTSEGVFVAKVRL